MSLPFPVGYLDVMVRPHMFAVMLLSIGCAPDLQVFEVTVRPIRNCHPAGVIPELCEARDSLEGKTSNTRFFLEMRSPTQFIFYEESGRSLAGNVERGQYFARSQHSEVSGNGCELNVERSVRFEVRRDVLPTIPGRNRRPDRIVGTMQDRTSRSSECGDQETKSRAEDHFVGDEIVEQIDWGFTLPVPPELPPPAAPAPPPGPPL